MNADSTLVPDLILKMKEMMTSLFQSDKALFASVQTIPGCTSVESMVFLLSAACEDAEYGDLRRVIWSEKIVAFVQGIFDHFPLLDKVEIVATILQSYKEHNAPIAEINGAHQFVLSVEE